MCLLFSFFLASIAPEHFVLGGRTITEEKRLFSALTMIPASATANVFQCTLFVHGLATTCSAVWTGPVRRRRIASWHSVLLETRVRAGPSSHGVGPACIRFVRLYSCARLYFYHESDGGGAKEDSEAVMRERRRRRAETRRPRWMYMILHTQCTKYLNRVTPLHTVSCIPYCL